MAWTDPQAGREEALKLLEGAELIHSAEFISAAVDKVATEITERIGETHPLILCVMTGGVVFYGQLMTRLNFPADFDYLHVTRYGQETTGGALSWRSAPWTNVKGRTVLVVDDILDEGITLAAIKDRLLHLGAASCHIAVAADKLNGKDKPVAADFVAVTVPDRFVFGYGMDAHGAWRNLPAIYAIKE